MYTYRCGDLRWSGGATIGYNGGPVGNFSENHPLSGDIAKNIACINLNITEWSNVVYGVSTDDYIPTDPPPTVEPRKSKVTANENGLVSAHVGALCSFHFTCSTKYLS